MTYGHLQADCLYTGISSGPKARYRVWEAFTFTFNRVFNTWNSLPTFNRVFNTWNSLPNWVVSTNTTNTCKARLDKF